MGCHFEVEMRNVKMMLMPCAFKYLRRNKVRDVFISELRHNGLHLMLISNKFVTDYIHILWQVDFFSFILRELISCFGYDHLKNRYYSRSVY